MSYEENKEEYYSQMIRLGIFKNPLSDEVENE
jgi:hypothetical protein